MNSASASFTTSPHNNATSSNAVSLSVYAIEHLPQESPKDRVVLRYLLEGSFRCRLQHYHFAMQEGQYLLSNPGQSFMIMGHKPATRVLQIEIPTASITQTIEADTAFGWETKTFLDRKKQYSFCEGAYESDEDALGQLLFQLAEAYGQPIHASEQKDFGQAVIEALIESQSKIFNHINRLTSAKLSTKKELYRRLLQAQEYIHENLHTNLDLDTLSQVACLSKFHFIRLFKEVFQVTPRQYLIACRLERASKMLVNTSKSFHEICLEVGLKDSSSFGRLFKKNYGATPHIYRRQYAQVG